MATTDGRARVRKLGRYLVQHALDRGYRVVEVCRAESLGKLDDFEGRMEEMLKGIKTRAERVKHETAEEHGRYAGHPAH